ncbi:MAG: class I SAM-dependent methyltransferase [Arenibacterium sp.]
MSKIWIEISDQLEATHRPVHDIMMARAGLQPGERVLDIGFGTGDTVIDAARAVGDDGYVLGLDIAPQMVVHAKARAADAGVTHVGLVIGDAQTHDFQPGQFDVAISKFGLMFFADTAAAFANIRKALRPGGRMEFAAWGPPQANPYFGLPRKAAVTQFGPVPPPDRDAPGPMRFGDAEPVLSALREAGWAADVETVDLKLTPLGSPRDFAVSQTQFGPAAMLIRDKEASDSDTAAIIADLTESYSAMLEDGQIKVPARIHFFSARVPG